MNDTSNTVLNATNAVQSADDLVYRLRKRAEIRRQIPTRKSVQEGQPDRIADLLDEAADEIDRLKIVVEYALQAGLIDAKDVGDCLD